MLLFIAMLAAPMEWQARFALLALVLSVLVPLVLAGSMAVAVRQPDGVAGTLCWFAKSGASFRL